MRSIMLKPALYSLTSVVIAAILLVSSLAIGNLNSSVGNLPGASLNALPFEDISTDNLTSMESFMYPADYDVISEKPYIIRVDYTNDYSVSVIDAELAAQQFVTKVFSNLSVQQLEINRLFTEMSKALPRWTISFKNINARVIVNAITGGIIGYSGSPIMCQGEVVNQSTAEEYATTALKELGYHIPVNLRIYSMNWTSYVNENDVTYRFRFQEVVNGIMVDSRIGTISVEIDGITGGIEYFSYQWIQVDDIPTDGVVSINAMGYGSILTLYRVSQDVEDFNEIKPQEFRLCWVKEDLWSGKTTVFDAFTGDLLYTVDSFGSLHSQDAVRLSFIMPLIVSVLPATLLYLGAKRILRQKM
ncbi:MAG: hypothetical protein ACFFBJ_07945 [Promethearchaeota archaeon]